MGEADLSERPSTFGGGAPDLRDLRDVFEATPPFATVVLDARSDVHDAGHRLEVRWRNARRQLEEAGAQDKMIEALGEALLGPKCDCGAAVAAIANPDGVLLCGPMPAPVNEDIVALAPLPRVAPLLEAHQSVVPHVLVVIDRAGADITVVGRQETLAELTVDGDHEHIHRGHPGGWAQRRFQQRAENTWEHNAADVAEVVSRASAAVDPDLILVAGEERATTFLREHLAPQLVDRLREIHAGGRGADGSAHHIEDEARRILATEVATAKVADLRTFKEERGQGDRAADGPARTVEALRQGQVETLLVHDDGRSGRTAWFGPEPTQLALERVELERMGVDEPREGRLVDAAIRAALGTGAAIRIVPAAGATTPSDGLGAILRFTVTP